MTFRARRRQTGGQIDRTTPLEFTFNGQTLQGFAGDTLASALLGAGVGIVNRSPVHNRPRGIMGAGTAEKNAYAVIDSEGTERHALASLLELGPGMSAESLWTWPPPSLVERVRGSSGPTPGDAYHQPVAPGFESATSFSHCDILIIGGGPAGLMAALAAGRAGARVILCDDQREPGGSLKWCPARINGKPGREWLADTLKELDALADVQMLDRAHFLGLSARDKAVVLRLRSDDRDNNGDPATGKRVEVWKVGAQQTIYATGADERLLAFGDNDMPGVMLSSAMLEYANRFAIEPMAQRIAVTTNNDSGYAMACGLFDSGLPIDTVIDLRTDLAAELVSPLVDRGIDLIGGHVISAVSGSEGVEEIELSRLHGSAGGIGQRLDVDAVAVCGGWNPRLSPFLVSGGEVTFDEQRLCLKPERGGPLDLIAGSANGIPGLANAFETALNASQRAIRECGLRADDSLKPPELETAPRLTPALPFWQMRQGAKASPQWVDLKDDRTAEDAVQDDPETIMVSPAAHPQVQPPPPLVSLVEVEQQIQKAVRQPRHLLPTHNWHTEAGAAFRLLQQWLRPAFYPQEGEAPEETLKRERVAVREKAGICDFSANGKVEVSGRDAASFLDRVYTIPVSSLEVGTLRDGFVLSEGGSVLEEGIIARLEEDRFYLTTSPGGGDRLVEWLETIRREDAAGAQLAIVPVTEQWATLMLSGPRARQIFLELKANVDVSTAGLPHQHIGTGDIGGAPARIFRTSPTGEVSFEICVPSGYGLPLWERLIAMGARLGLTPVGEDTLAQLAAEKGRIPARQAIDNGLSPIDLGYEAKPFEDKESFIGRRALLRPAGTAGSKLELVALRGETREQVLPAGARVSFTTRENEQEEGSLGTVLIGFYSEPVNQAINLALVSGGRSQQGAEVSVRPDGQQPVNARIIQIHTYDPGGRRPHG